MTLEKLRTLRRSTRGATAPLNILFISTPVGPLGSGIGGGVELTIMNSLRALSDRGHHVQALAPLGSPEPAIGIAGALHVPCLSHADDPGLTMPVGSVLAAMLDEAERRQDDYDVIVSFAYDWLPFRRRFRRPAGFVVTMSALGYTVPNEVRAQSPRSLAFYSRAQASTFSIAPVDYAVLGFGIDLDRYPFVATPDRALAWASRISPEKGLEDALRAARVLQRRLRICGVVQDRALWQDLSARFADTIEYEGFVDTARLAEVLGGCGALLMTPKWEEAFGIVAIESLACGVPVVAYGRGGLNEIVRDGETGLLVSPDDPRVLARAAESALSLDRAACRADAEARFSLPAFGKRFEHWLYSLVRGSA